MRSVQIALIVALAGLALSRPIAQSGSPASSAPTRQVSDITGRVVTIPARVTRVADPWHANNGMVLMMGAAHKIVATTLQARRQPWFRKLFPPIEQVPAAFDEAGGVNIETLIAARPDVVLMAYGGTLPRWKGTADAYGIPVFMMPNTSLADLKTTARMTGDVLGPQESARAAGWIRYFDDNIRWVTAVTARIPGSERPRVLHTATGTILTIDGVKTVVDDWITVAGGVNAATVVGNARPVSMEQIAAWNPDVIIVGTAPNEANRRAILSDPRWSQIKAVRTGRVYVNPTGVYLWDRHSAEAALQVLWAAKTLHPSRFPDLDLRKETKAFYAKFFNHTLDDAEYETLMRATAP
ncbi:MAG TPA: ABC transporter substrate-binding protein [Vicinamibacterales bacterium]|nr:ABC transporter substrate-binding protein [Vicinamibacterales bacterium]